MPTRIQPTIDALKGNLQDIAAKRGVELIGRWEGDLGQAEWRGAKTIHADLVALRRHLEGEELDGAKIKELLVKLGQETARAASHAEGTAGEGLKRLGEALEQSAQTL